MVLIFNWATESWDVFEAHIRYTLSFGLAGFEIIGEYIFMFCYFVTREPLDGFNEGYGGVARTS